MGGRNNNTDSPAPPSATGAAPSSPPPPPRRRGAASGGGGGGRGGRRRLSAVAAAPPPPPLKVIVLGDSNVGKTSLVSALGESSGLLHPEDESAASAAMAEAARRVGETRGSTIGVDCTPVRFRGDGWEEVKLHVWDTAGQERFRSIVRGYFRNADIAILLCSADDASTVDDLRDCWLPSVEEICSPLTVCGILCNKTDVQTDEVAVSEIERTEEEEERGDGEGDDGGSIPEIGAGVVEVTTAREAAERFARERALPFAACSLFNDPLPALRVVRSLVREALRRRMAREAAARAAALEARMMEEDAAAAAARPSSSSSPSSFLDFAGFDGGAFLWAHHHAGAWAGGGEHHQHHHLASSGSAPPPASLPSSWQQHHPAARPGTIRLRRGRLNPEDGGCALEGGPLRPSVAASRAAAGRGGGPGFGGGAGGGCCHV